jgi:hypothetical protein
MTDRRLATAREDALFALFLASNESDFFVGQSMPFSGGWAQQETSGSLRSGNIPIQIEDS